MDPFVDVDSRKGIDSVPLLQGGQARRARGGRQHRRRRQAAAPPTWQRYDSVPRERAAVPEQEANASHDCCRAKFSIDACIPIHKTRAKFMHPIQARYGRGLIGTSPQFSFAPRQRLLQAYSFARAASVTDDDAPTCLSPTLMPLRLKCDCISHLDSPHQQSLRQRPR